MSPADGGNGPAADADDVYVRLTPEAVTALWSAVHALENRASGARWRKTQPNPPLSLDDSIEKAMREARVLRDARWARRSGPGTRKVARRLHSPECRKDPETPLLQNNPIRGGSYP